MAVLILPREAAYFTIWMYNGECGHHVCRRFSGQASEFSDGMKQIMLDNTVIIECYDRQIGENIPHSFERYVLLKSEHQFSQPMGLI